MPILPASKNLTAVQSATFLYVFRRVQNKQTITLAGTGTGTWRITVFNQQTVALARSATLSDVQAALATNTRIGGNGVTVSGTPGTTYTLNWTGKLASTEMDLVQVTVSTDLIASVDYVAFDWTGWTADWSVKLTDANGNPTGSAIVHLTDTASTPGQIILGYVFPTTPGGTEPTPDRTNGNVAIKIKAATTAGLPALLTGSAVHSLLVTSSGTPALTQALLDGAFSCKQEPN